ncbi:MAG: MotA/TolQ/ExbB proton channel family protein [Prevotella sp.]|nr:MotA/TolQ/ExbB proton channel family protein [Prevotella sp.]
MEFISKALFGIANSLLIPDIILLIFFFFRALMMLGGTYSQFMTRRRNDMLLDTAIKELQPDGISHLRSLLPKQPDSLLTKYLADLLAHPGSEAYADYIITHYETEAAKDVNLARLLTKLGPVLGLIGTLISMSPALVGLSTGDISGMAYNMQVVFSATVVGLVISAVGLYTQQLKSRWYAKDVNRLDYVSRIYQLSNEKET